MKTLKRAIVGSFLALSVFAAPAASVAAEVGGDRELYWVVLCSTCGEYHLIPSGIFV